MFDGSRYVLMCECAHPEHLRFGILPRWRACINFYSFACVIYNGFHKSVFVFMIILHLQYRVCQKFSLLSNLTLVIIRPRCSQPIAIKLSCDVAPCFGRNSDQIFITDHPISLQRNVVSFSFDSLLDKQMTSHGDNFWFIVC